MLVLLPLLLLLLPVVCSNLGLYELRRMENPPALIITEGAAHAWLQNGPCDALSEIHLTGPHKGGLLACKYRL